jgi:hypothetical protein
MLIYFMAIWNIVWIFGIFYDHSVVHFCVHLVHFSSIGIMRQEKSGNPALQTIRRIRSPWSRPKSCIKVALVRGSSGCPRSKRETQKSAKRNRGKTEAAATTTKPNHRFPDSDVCVRFLMKFGKISSRDQCYVFSYFRRKIQRQNWRFWLKTKLNYAKFCFLYWFFNIFVEKFSVKIGVFDSKQS